eukprot:TRINITY_DN10223_c0_g1_i1.p1 TRINITY_DN10223_c0_g1~~TRINITY_DN10223_c0_g1_i1.p1  ORF type:complete len:215 (-),score=45.32 TRINITY_DN10223_c0_g1_i1:43-687(-)
MAQKDHPQNSPSAPIPQDPLPNDLNLPESVEKILALIPPPETTYYIILVASSVFLGMGILGGYALGRKQAREAEKPSASNPMPVQIQPPKSHEEISDRYIKDWARDMGRSDLTAQEIEFFRRPAALATMAAANDNGGELYRIDLLQARKASRGGLRAFGYATAINAVAATAVVAAFWMCGVRSIKEASESLRSLRRKLVGPKSQDDPKSTSNKE